MLTRWKMRLNGSRRYVRKALRCANQEHRMIPQCDEPRDRSLLETTLDCIEGSPSASSAEQRISESAFC
jgi:hypothetical protein